MPWFVILYLICAVIALVLSAIGHSRKNEVFILAAAVIGFVSALIMGFGVAGMSTGAGHYAYYVNGVRVASGLTVFFQAFAFAIIFGALPNVLGLAIASMPKAFSTPAGGNASKGLKFLSIFFMAEGILGFIIAIVLMIVRKSFSGAMTGSISSAITFLIGFFIKKKWNIR